MKNVFPQVSISPIYGRDYKSKAQVREALMNNLDFIVRDISCPWNGKWCNLKDLKADYKFIKIRYQKLQKIAIWDIQKEAWVKP